MTTTKSIGLCCPKRCSASLTSCCVMRYAPDLCRFHGCVVLTLAVDVLAPRLPVVPDPLYQPLP